MPGRPRKNRVKAQSKNNYQVIKVSRKMTCSNCQQSGYNKTSCDKDPVPKLPMVNRAPVPKPPEYATYASARGGWLICVVGYRFVGSSGYSVLAVDRVSSEC
ncbi:hypothetical protein Tco_0930567 [Tanacetum coccineum]